MRSELTLIERIRRSFDLPAKSPAVPSPPAVDGYSVLRRTVAGLLGVTLPHREPDETGADFLGTSREDAQKRAALLDASGNSRAAIAWYRRAWSFGDTKALGRAAELLAEDGDLDESIRLFRMAFEWGTRDLRRQIVVALDRLDPAIPLAIYRSALGNKDQFTTVGLATLLLRHGHLDEAAELCSNSVVEGNPSWVAGLIDDLAERDRSGEAASFGFATMPRDKARAAADLLVEVSRATDRPEIAERMYAYLQEAEPRWRDMDLEDFIDENWAGSRTAAATAVSPGNSGDEYVIHVDTASRYTTYGRALPRPEGVTSARQDLVARLVSGVAGLLHTVMELLMGGGRR